jgi:hypothetical protein
VFPLSTRKNGPQEHEKRIVVLYKGDEEIGPKEIQKLIDMLTAQKAALED